MIYPANSFREEGRLPETTVIDSVEIVRNHIPARITELGITQDVAAVQCGMPLRQLQRIIKNTQKHGPLLTDTVKLAIGLGTTVEALFVFKIRRIRMRSHA